MITMLLRAHIKPGKRDELIDFLKWDQRVARDSEPGTLRFDFYDDPDGEDALYLYESYRDEEAFEQHKANEPFEKFMDQIRPECIGSIDVLLSRAVEIGTA